MRITKSDFLKFKNCSSQFWFSKFKPEVLTEEILDDFVERLQQQGVEVELFARGLYPEAVLVEGNLDAAAQQTEDLIAQGTKQLFQASFMVDDLFSACDVLVWNELYQGWDIIEIKSSTSKVKKKEVHLSDAAFQKIILEKAGLKVVNVYLLELNKEYHKDGDIDLNTLFNKTEITTDCIALEKELLADIQAAKQLLTQGTPTDCSCKYKGRRNHCTAFKHLYPQVSDYSIYDLRAIGGSKKVLKQIVESGHLEINDIPPEIKMGPSIEKQHRVHTSGTPIFEKALIKEALDALVYPIYFLDYETLPLGIPKYENTFPYQQTVFQYSLHILAQDDSIVHKEFIHRDTSTPVYIVAEKLRADIGDVGSVIVWNKKFERKCNQDLAKVNPDLSTFLTGVNDRIYDLMEVFQKMHYVHPDFHGKYSIKKVLPVMCPELSYDSLEVSNGVEAVVAYEELMFGDTPEEEHPQKFKDLLAYCELDTLAMVKILKRLESRCDSSV